ncbi:type IV toxin-antitoxin system AbiEi family antitoxin domain-containing protein [Frankia sp. AgB32]|uniref:type IV toxin-antitoxin system AbiEi family antitoxin domain-containing protein n=1 Tax=Frankia sp. AgB32 TaxID=631119 RepID=UPI00200E3769|nr:type IV toxin-antitoxin system AbiEi family antitoxin domain-containing protein [Frankia sp. AgB32]MCK9894565.1 DUF559 domain-containing protein [Frankia sp. AgB32]
MTTSLSASTPPTRPAARAYPGLDSAVALARRQGGMITFRQAIAAGLTRGQLRQLVQSDQWGHPVRGAFVVPGAGRAERVPPVAGAPATARGAAGCIYPAGSALSGGDPGGEVVAILPARGAPPSALAARARAALVGRPRAVVCGATAAGLLGFPAVESDNRPEPVHLMLPARLTRAQPRGIRLHFTDLPAGERMTLAGIPVTAPARTLADLVLAASTRDAAVAVMDGALRSGVVADLRAARRAAAGRRGFRTVDAWWSLADGRAESALESRLRLLLADAGLAPSHLQWPVTDAAGQVVARLDLAWPSHRLVVEADTCAAVGSAGALHRERQRGNLLAAHGWTVLRFGVLDLAWHPDQIVAAVERVLAGREEVSPRAS